MRSAGGRLEVDERLARGDVRAWLALRPSPATCDDVDVAARAIAAATIRSLCLGLSLAMGSAGCFFDEAGVELTPGPGADGAPAEPDAGRADAADAGAAADARVDFNCPAPYQPATVNGRTSYRIRNNPSSWTDAESDCESDGPGIHLAVIDDAVELHALDDATNVANLWVGVSDRNTGGVFLRVTGGPADFLPWTAGEPNDQGFGEDCVELVGAGINDEGCDDAQAYICECDGVPADPAAF